MAPNDIVSVIVPCYKQADYLPETLDSVIAQTYANWECIIVNDGSPDQTENVASLYCQRDNRIRYISQDNSGVSEARNNGIRHSVGKYILPLDADDVIDKTYIEKAICCFENDSSLKLFTCRKAYKFGVESGIMELPIYEYNKLKWGNLFFCTSMFKRKDFDLTNGFDISLKNGLEDWDFWLTFIKPSDRVFQTEELLFGYRIKSRSRNVQAWDYISQLHQQIVRNHMDVYEEECTRVIDYHEKATLYDGIMNNTIARNLYKFMRFVKQNFIK